MAALKSGLQKNNLPFSLKKKYPKDFADLLARAERYARTEKAFKLKDEEVGKEQQAGDSSKPAAEKGPSEARPRSRTLPQTQAYPNSSPSSYAEKPRPQSSTELSPKKIPQLCPSQCSKNLSTDGDQGAAAKVRKDAHTPQEAQP